MQHEFEPEARAIESDAELHALLERLHAAQQLLDEPPSPHEEDHRVHVEDVAEALDLPVETVLEALTKLRSESHEARIAAAIRDLEEPLYRVERPSTDATPKSDPILRSRSAQQLASKLNLTVPLPRRKLALDAEEKHGRWLGQRVLMVLFALMIALITYGVVQNLINR